MVRKNRIRLTRHVGYSAKYSPEKNVILGKHHHESYLEVGRQLQALANLEHRTNPKAARVFHESALLAFRKHSQGYK